MISTAFAANAVVITPENPANGETLTCILQGADPSLYNFNWYVNGRLDGNSNTLRNIYVGHAIISCKVFYPATSYTGPILLGEASVTIANSPPAITSDPSRIAVSGQLYSYQIAASDPDNDALIYSLTTKPEGMAINSNTISWTPSESQVGTNNVVIQVSDASSSATQSFTITVSSSGTGNNQTNTSTNHAPILNSIGNKQILENSLLQFTISATDSDNDTLIFSASNLPSGASFNSGTKTFSWTPAHSQIGSYQITFTVSDGQTTDDETITVMAYAPNQEPIIHSLNILNKVSNYERGYIWNTLITGPLSGIAGTLNITRTRNLTFNAAAADPDSDSLSFNWYINGPLASIGQSFSKTFDIAGNYNVTLEVNDGNTTKSTGIEVYVQDENLYGKVYDIDTGQPVSGVNISFYDASVYDVVNGTTGDYSNLQPKSVPDTISDKDGNYNAYLPVSGSLAVYHMVIQGSDEKDFEINVNNSGKKKHDVELDENRVILPEVNFNAEGHIIYSGKYENGNKYICNEKVQFTMFGVNNGDTNETITFDVQDHTANGNPDSPILYNGSLLNSDESLTVNAGEKIYKTFYFKIPCSYPKGKYDIHVIWNNETWHKIGNFFVIQDTINPSINIAGMDNLRTFVNKSVDVLYQAGDPYQPGTVSELEQVMRITMGVDARDLGIYLDKDIINDSDHDGIANNDQDYVMPNYTLDPFLSKSINYSKEGYYQARLFAVDGDGNTGEQLINISVFATEDQVRKIWYDLTQACDNSSGFYEGNCYWLWNNANVTQDIGQMHVVTDYFDTTIGFEYRSDTDGLDLGGSNFSVKPTCNEAVSSGDGATGCERDYFNSLWYQQTFVLTPRVLILDPSTQAEAAAAIKTFMNFMNSKGIYS